MMFLSPVLADQLDHVLQDLGNIFVDIVQQLALVHGNATLVGDPNQTIYTWRQVRACACTSVCAA